MKSEKEAPKADLKSPFPFNASLLDNVNELCLVNQLISKNSFLGTKCRISGCMVEDNVYISNFPVIDNGSTIGDNVLIGAYSRIWNSKIGHNAIICNYAKLYNVEIGFASVIGSFSEIGHGTILGDYFDIRPGAKINSECKIKVIKKGGETEILDIKTYMKGKGRDLRQYTFI